MPDCFFSTWQQPGKFESYCYIYHCALERLLDGLEKLYTKYNVYLLIFDVLASLLPFSERLLCNVFCSAFSDSIAVFLLFARYVSNVAKMSIWNQCNIEDRPIDQCFWKSLPGSTSNSHISITVLTWPQTVKVVTPLSLKRHISVTMPDRRMRWLEV